MDHMVWLTKLGNWIASWFSRRARIRGLLRRLRLELNRALTKARTYLKTTGEGKENTPSYRCSTGAYDQGSNLLAGYDVFDSEGLDKVEEAYDQIRDFNRCLQMVHDARGESHFGDEVLRARVKAGNVRQSAPNAITVVDAALSRYE